MNAILDAVPTNGTLHIRAFKAPSEGGRGDGAFPAALDIE